MALFFCFFSGMKLSIEKAFSVGEIVVSLFFSFQLTTFWKEIFCAQREIIHFPSKSLSFTGNGIFGQLFAGPKPPPSRESNHFLKAHFPSPSGKNLRLNKLRKNLNNKAKSDFLVVVVGGCPEQTSTKSDFGERHTTQSFLLKSHRNSYLLGFCT